MLGLEDVARGAFDGAETHFDAARTLFVRADDKAHAAFMSLQLGEIFDFQGRNDLGWSHRLLALDALPALLDVHRQRTLLQTVAARATDSGSPRAALAFLAHAISLRGAPGEDSDPELGLERARAELAVGAHEAEDTLFEQEELIRKIGDSVRRERLLGEFFRVASGFPSTGSSRVRRALDDGIPWMAARSESAREAPLLVQRGLARAAAGDRSRARADFNRAIDLLRGESESDLDLRMSRRALAGSCIEQLIAIALDEGSHRSSCLRWPIADGSSRAMVPSAPPRVVMSPPLSIA